jgi:hypothetical protein
MTFRFRKLRFGNWGVYSGRKRIGMIIQTFSNDYYFRYLASNFNSSQPLKRYKDIEEIKTAVIKFLNKGTKDKNVNKPRHSKISR